MAFIHSLSGFPKIVWISKMPEITEIKFYVSLQLNIQLQTVFWENKSTTMNFSKHTKKNHFSPVKAWHNYPG